MDFYALSPFLEPFVVIPEGNLRLQSLHDEEIVVDQSDTQKPAQCGNQQSSLTTKQMSLNTSARLSPKSGKTDPSRQNLKPAV